MKAILKTFSMVGLCLLLGVTACNSKKSETTSGDTATMGTTPDGNMGSTPADSTMMMDSTSMDSTKM